MIHYPTLHKTIASLTEGEDDTVALMATVACEVHHADDRFDWTGFYRVTAPGMLKIGPYQGGHGCQTPTSRATSETPGLHGITIEATPSGTPKNEAQTTRHPANNTADNDGRDRRGR